MHDTAQLIYYNHFVLQVHLIQESLVVFVCGTTGDGEEPDNMKV